MFRSFFLSFERGSLVVLLYLGRSLIFGFVFLSVWKRAFSEACLFKCYLRGNWYICEVELFKCHENLLHLLLLRVCLELLEQEEDPSAAWLSNFLGKLSIEWAVEWVSDGELNLYLISLFLEHRQEGLWPRSSKGCRKTRKSHREVEKSCNQFGNKPTNYEVVNDEPKAASLNKTKPPKFKYPRHLFHHLSNRLFSFNTLSLN